MIGPDGVIALSPAVATWVFVAGPMFGAGVAIAVGLTVLHLRGGREQRLRQRIDRALGDTGSRVSEDEEVAAKPGRSGGARLIEDKTSVDGDVSRRGLGFKLVAAAGLGAVGAEAFKPRPAHAAMAVFDGAAVAKLAEQINQTVKQIEMLGDMARLDKLALDALGEMGMDTGFLDGLFSPYERGMNTNGPVQRLTGLPPQIETNFESGLGNIQNIDQRLQTFESARGVFDELYKKQVTPGISGLQAKEVERVIAKQLRTATIDQMALATSERKAVSEAGKRIEELAEQARTAGKGKGDNQNMRAQLGVMTSAILEMLGEMQAQRALLATMAQTDAASRLNIPVQFDADVVGSDAKWGPLKDSENGAAFVGHDGKAK